MANLLRHRLIAALILGAGMVWTLSGDLQAREVDLDHKVVPQTEIKDSPLRLVGTAVTGDPRQRLAVIESMQSRQQWVFHEGDHAGHILIKKIRRDNIVIEAGEGEQMVKLRRFLIYGDTSTHKPSPEISLARFNRVPSRERHRVIDRATVEATLADPETVLQNIDIMPARFLNREMGFRIAGFDTDSIFSKMGLRSGDLLLAINDQEIVGPQEAPTIFETFRKGGDIDLTVRRRARTYHINLMIR